MCALIVTYNPDGKLLSRMLQGIVSQVDQVLIVDNGSEGPPPSMCRDGPELSFEVLPLGRNLGLATAQNLGARWARERGFSHVLLLDQDSLVESGMVAALWEGLGTLLSRRSLAGSKLIKINVLTLYALLLGNSM